MRAERLSDLMRWYGLAEDIEIELEGRDPENTKGKTIAKKYMDRKVEIIWNWEFYIKKNKYP